MLFNGIYTLCIDLKIYIAQNLSALVNSPEAPFICWIKYSQLTRRLSVL